MGNHAKASNQLYEDVGSRGEVLLQILPIADAGVESTDAATDGAEKSGKDAAVDPRMMNAMGLMQWGIILQFALYFYTYTADMQAAAVSASKRDDDKAPAHE